MKKIFLMLLLISSICFSQAELKDQFKYKVIYKLTYQLDSTDIDSEKSEYMTLFLGDEYSRYSSRAKTLANSVVINGNTARTSRSALTHFHYEIVKDYNSANLYYLLKIPKMNDRFRFTQEKDLFNWKIEEERKSIQAYKVQKATTTFAGRDYIAWFAPEIPISDGPYKFNGLPGLILEIHDTQNYWNFEFFGLKKLSPNKQFRLNLKNYAKTNQEDLATLWYRYRRDPMGYANNPNVKIHPEVHKSYIESFTKILEKENNPIELN